MRGHLIGGDVVGIVLDEEIEFVERFVGVVFGGVGHGEAVAGEGVGGVLLEHLGEKGDSVHVLMVRCWGARWQVVDDLVPWSPCPKVRTWAAGFVAGAAIYTSRNERFDFRAESE